jgi:hypothetical protein
LIIDMAGMCRSKRGGPDRNRWQMYCRARPCITGSLGTEGSNVRLYALCAAAIPSFVEQRQCGGHANTSGQAMSAVDQPFGRSEEST